MLGLSTLNIASGRSASLDRRGTLGGSSLLGRGTSTIWETSSLSGLSLPGTSGTSALLPKSASGTALAGLGISSPRLSSQKSGVNISSSVTDLVPLKRDFEREAKEAQFESDIQKLRAGLTDVKPHSSNLGVLDVPWELRQDSPVLRSIEASSHHASLDLQSTRGSEVVPLHIPDLHITQSSILQPRSLAEDMAIKTEMFQEKLEIDDVKRREEFHSKMLGDQVSHLLADISEMRNEMKGMARREDSLRSELSSEISQRQEIERHISAIVSKEKEIMSVMEMQAQDMQKVANASSEGKRALEDALDRGLKAVSHSLEKGLEKEAEHRSDMNRVASQTMKAALEQHVRERDDALKLLRQEREESFRQHTKDRQEAIQAQHREAMEHMAIEKQLRDEGQRLMQDGIRALEQNARDQSERQLRDQAEALKVLEHKMRTERDEVLQIIKQERDEAFRQHAKERQEAIQEHYRDSMDHIAKERQLRDEAQRAVNENFKGLEMKVQREMEIQFKNSAEALRVLEQRIRAEREETLKVLRQEKDEAFRQHTKERQEMIQEHYRDAIERIAQEKKLRDEAHRSLEDGTKALEIKLHRDMDKQSKDQAEVLKDLEQKLRTDLQRLAGETSSKMKDMNDLVQANSIDISSKTMALINDLRNDLDKTSKSTNAKADTFKDTLERQIDQLQKKMEGSLTETHRAVQVLIAEQNKAAADEQATVREAQNALRTELQGRQAVLENLLNKVQDELRSDLANISSIHDKKHEQTKEMVKSMNDHHNSLHDSISEAMDVMHKKLQDALATLRSDMDGNNGSLREVLMEVTKQVDNLDANIQKEQLRVLAAEDKLEKAIIQLRSDVSESLEETQEALRLDLVAHGKNADEIKAAMQEVQKSFKSEHYEHKTTIETTLQQQVAMDKKLQEELAELKLKHSALETESQKNTETFHGVLVEAAKHVEELEEGAKQEQKRIVEMEQRLDTSREGLRTEIMQVILETKKAVDQNLELIGKGLDEERAGRQDSEKTLKTQLSERDGRLKQFADETTRSFTEIRDLHSQITSELEVAVKNDLEMLRDFSDKKQEELQKTMDSINKSHEDKGSELTVSIQKLTTTHAESKRVLEESLKSGLDTLSRRFAEGLEKEANVRAEQDDLTTQAMKAALEQHSKERAEALNLLRQERDEAFRQNAKDRQEAMQAQQREHMAQVAKEKQVRDESFANMQDALTALEAKIKKDMDDQTTFEAEALKALGKRLREERDSSLKLMRQEREEAFRQNEKNRSEALKAQQRENMDHLAKERQMRDEAHLAQQEALKNLEIQLRKDMDKMLKDREKVTKDLEQSLNADIRGLAGEHSSTIKDMKERLQAATVDITNKLSISIKDLQNNFEKSLKSTNARADTNKEALEQIIDQMQKKTQGSLVETRTAMEKLSAELDKSLQDKLATMKSDMDGKNITLRDILMDVTKQVDTLDANIQKEHDELVAAEERLDKTISEFSSQASYSIEEVKKALSLEMAEHGKIADEIKAASQEARRTLELSITDHKTTSEKMFVDQKANYQKLQQELASLKTLQAGLEREFKQSSESFHGVLVEAAKHVEELEETTKQELKNQEGWNQKLEEARAATHKEVMQVILDTKKATDQNLETMRKDLKQEQALRKDSEKMLKTELTDRDEALDRHTKHFAEETARNLKDLRAVASKASQDLEEVIRRDMEKLKDANERKYSDLQRLIESIDKSHHDKRAQNRAAIQDHVSNKTDGVQRKLQDELENLKQNIDGKQVNVQDVLHELNQQVEAVEDHVNKEKKARLAGEARLEKLYNELRQDETKKKLSATRRPTAFFQAPTVENSPA